MVVISTGLLATMLQSEFVFDEDTLGQDYPENTALAPEGSQICSSRSLSAYTEATKRSGAGEGTISGA